VTRHAQRGQSIIELAIILPVLLFVFLGAWTGAALIANNDTATQATSYGAQIAASIGNVQCTSSTTCTAAYACQTSWNDPCAADAEIIAAVTPTLDKQLSNSAVDEIDIYRPQSCGALNPSPSTTPPPCPASPNGALVWPSGGRYSSSDNVTCGSGGLCVDVYEYCGTTFTWDLVDGQGTRTGSGSCTTGGVAPYTLDLRVQAHPAEASIGVAVTFQFSSPGLKFFSQTDTQYTALTFPPQEN